MKSWLKKCLMWFTGTLLSLMVCYGLTYEPAPTSVELTSKYPNINQDSVVLENKKILCPFWRLVVRSGLIDNPQEPVSVSKIIEVAEKLGCANFDCGLVALTVSYGQDMLGKVDLEHLDTAKGVAHQCGLTFKPNGVVVDDGVRQQTIDSLRQVSNNGRLDYQQLLDVKLEICRQQGVKITSAGQAEVKLIYTYLGGVDNGYITVDDVDRFFHSEMPWKKSNKWIRFVLFNQIDD